ncbi:MAG: penicillin acylase family protein [Desulfosudaceae bacterium]
MARPLFRQGHFFPAAGAALIILFFLGSGCHSLLDTRFNNALPPTEGEKILPGLDHPVTVQRDDLGIPFIDARSLEDLVVAIGYVNACDRFSQMEGFRLLGQGRLSEMVGPAALEMDMYLRALNVAEIAEVLYESASPELRHLLQRYSDGVNAYLAEDNLPMTVKLSGHIPEKWESINSVSVFIVLTLGLAQNLHEEIGILNLAGQIEPEKLAWLTPIYPDEPLPFEEMEKLAGLDLAPATRELQDLFATISQTNRLIVPAAAASNNWVVSGRRTASGKPILANDTHLPLAMPSYWHLIKVRCGRMEGAGVALAGVPGIVAGYNRHMAVGMTMVMADNQDIFLEKLKRKEDGLYYLYQGEWLKTTTRQETFRVKGEEDVIKTVHETVHGPLLNNILTTPPRHPLVPLPADQSLGLAVSWAAFEPDRTMDAFFKTMTATSVDEVLENTGSDTSIIPLNLVMADENDIAWQVTGRFPLRKKGRGLCPSPGWTGDYDWQGFLDPSLHPSVKNPEQGYLGTANHRTVPADFPHVLSSSWYYPDRARRIEEMIEATDKFTVADARAMQLDTHSRFAAVIQEALLNETTAARMASTWENDPAARKKAARGLRVLADFDGDMRVDSAGAAFCGAFLSCLARNLFADECGGTDTPAWKSLTEIFLMSYSALHDHLTERGRHSPFWDNVTTDTNEERHDILAATVLDAVELLEKRLGPSPDQWHWGELHQYEWMTDASRLAPHMGFLDKTGLKFLSGYLDRGPYPAPGDHTTLNVAAYHPGNDFDVWLIPAMRLIADFGAEEPLIGINSSGQSDNPASPHYDDGLQAWRNGQYQPFPFQQEHIEHQYDQTLRLVPEP